MQKTVLFLALVAFVSTIQGNPLIDNNLDKIRTECLSQTNFDGDILENALKTENIPDLTNDYASYMICSYKKQGYLNEKGELNYDAVEDFICNFYDRDLIRPRVRACRTNQKGGTTEEKTYNFAKCLIDKLRELDR